MINGISIIINALSGLNNLAEYTNYLYLHSGRISGITTFTEFSTLASPLAVYLLLWVNKYRMRLYKTSRISVFAAFDTELVI